MSYRRAVLIGLLLWLPLPAAGGTEGRESTLPELMQLLAESGGVRAHYSERKHLALLREPLESRGVLFFEPPDRLARRVETPGRAWLAVRDDEVVMRDATGEERLPLGRSEVARGLVESFAVVLRGDLDVLRARYEVDFRADASGWRMELRPRSRALRHLLRSIAIRGVGRELRRVELNEENGDRTVTAFTQVETGIRFTPDESREIFLLAPAPPAPHE